MPMAASSTVARACSMLQFPERRIRSWYSATWMYSSQLLRVAARSIGHLSLPRVQQFPALQTSGTAGLARGGCCHSSPKGRAGTRRFSASFSRYSRPRNSYCVSLDHPGSHQRDRRSGGHAYRNPAWRKVTVYTDPEFNTDGRPEGRDRKRRTLDATAAILCEAGIQVAFVARVHSKVLIGDDDLYCVGSFNWFSARRDAQYARHETSLAYRGPGLTGEIDVMRASLRERIIEVPLTHQPQSKT